MQIITSRQNPLIKHVAALRTAKNRAEHQQFVAEGVRTCSSLVENNLKLMQLFVLPEHVPAAHKLANDELITQVDTSVMEKISTAKSPSGFLGLFAIPANPEPSALTAGLVLANISNPGNMGTLIRSAAAFGAQSVVVIDGADVWSPKVIHASAGTIGAIKIFRWSWDELLQNKKNMPLHALVVNNGTPIHEIKNAHALLVVGNEAHGLPAHWQEQCDQRVTIPMAGNTESLNVAVAGSIACFCIFSAQ